MTGNRFLDRNMVSIVSLKHLETGTGYVYLFISKCTYYVLQHFPMYRVSDSVCSGPDAAIPELRNVRLRQRWDCLSKEASDEVCMLLVTC